MRRYSIVGAFCLLLCAQPAPAAVDLASIAAYAAIASEVVSMFDSGANPYMTQVAQNHRMLQLMHERLDDFSDAFARVIKKLNDMPESVRREIEYAQNDAYRRQLVGHIDRIQKDLARVARGKTPLFSPKERLAGLEKHSDRVRTSAEDLNLPYIILGMQVEKAFYYGMGLEDHWHGVAGIDGIQDIYHQRIRKMLESKRPDSLVSSRANLARDIESKVWDLKIQLSHAEVNYITSYEEVGICHTYRYVDIDASTRRTRSQLAQKIREHELPIVMQMHDVYGVLISTAQYVLSAMDGDTQEQRPARLQPKDFLKHPTNVPDIAAIFQQAMKAHVPRIKQAKKDAREHNRRTGAIVSAESKKYSHPNLVECP